MCGNRAGVRSSQTWTRTQRTYMPIRRPAVLGRVALISFRFTAANRIQARDDFTSRVVPGPILANVLRCSRALGPGFLLVGEHVPHQAPCLLIGGIGPTKACVIGALGFGGN